MRGRHEEQEVMLAHVDIEGRVPKDHPLRTIKTVADEALQRLSPKARLMRKSKGREAKLSFMGHALMENGNGLLMDFVVSRATGRAEREAVPVMLDDARQRGYRPRTLGADKGYDTRECVRAMRNRGVTPHVARRTHSAIDGRTTRHAGYRASQKVRKRVEEVFGWMKTVGGLRRTRYRGVERTGLARYFVATAYNPGENS